MTKTKQKPHKEGLTADMHKAEIHKIETPHKLVAFNYHVIVYSKEKVPVAIWSRIVGNESKADQIVKEWSYARHFLVGPAALHGEI